MARPLKDDFQLIDGIFYCTIKVAAQLFGVSTQSVRMWRDRPNPPPYDDDLSMYPVNKLGEWIRTEQIYKQGVGGSFPYKPDMSRYGEDDPTPVTMMPGLKPKIAPKKESQQDRYERLRADKLEMEINTKAGSLVMADEVLLAMSSMVSRVKMRLLALPSQLATTLAMKSDAVDIQEYMDEELRIALEELSPDWTREIDFETDEETDDEDEDD